MASGARAPVMGHLRDVGMTWPSHLIRAWTISIVFLLGALRLLLHGLLPWMDQEAGQRTLHHAARLMGEDAS